jgi:hypothetical protein
MARPASASDSAAGFGIARVFRRALGAAGGNLITLVALIALAAIPERALYHLVDPESPLLQSLSRLTLVTAGLLLQLAVIRLSLGSFKGKRAGLGACAGQAFRSFFPVMGIGLLAMVPLGLGLLLALVPGAMLAMAWSVLVPVQIAEGAGVIACFKRSAELTRGHRWKILAVFLLLGVGLAPLLLVLQTLWGVPLSAHAQFFAQNWLARLLFDAAVGLVLAGVYWELRETEPA